MLWDVIWKGMAECSSSLPVLRIYQAALCSDVIVHPNIRLQLRHVLGHSHCRKVLDPELH